MTKLSSQPTIRKIVEKYKTKFDIKKESQNTFNFDGAYYHPDLSIYNPKNNKLLALVEIEQGTRKHVIGGIITADYCMGLIKQKPIFCVLALTKQDLLDYKKRIKLINAYTRNLKKVVIGDFNTIDQVLQKLVRFISG